MSVLIVGSTALDSIKTPKAENPRLLGGSASHAAVAASFFSPVKLVGVVGEDFPAKYIITTVLVIHHSGSGVILVDYRKCANNVKIHANTTPHTKFLLSHTQQLYRMFYRKFSIRYQKFDTSPFIQPTPRRYSRHIFSCSLPPFLPNSLPLSGMPSN